ncbi:MULTISPECIES: ROK family protein [unclassified Microbacterium]|uniref:ROK family transcriptional regulator n=1 Tax=unclassified Microbacterium TaxID=2609290 RepID=UPI003658D676
MMKSGTPRDLRTLNEGAVLAALFEHGPLTRPEIEQITGLSKPAAARLLLRVEEAGVIVRDGERASRSGPPAQIWRVNPRAALVAGITVTAERLVVEVCDLDGRLIGDASAQNPVRSSDEIAPALRALIESALEGADADIAQLRDVTIGLPGVIDPLGGVLVHSVRLPAWVDIDVIGALGAALPGVAVYTANDVGLVLIAEAEHGAARDVASVALIWVGSGIKAGYLRDGELMVGPHGLAGEIGRVIVPSFGAAPDASAERGRAVPGGGVLLEQLLRPQALAALGDDVDAIADRFVVVVSSVTALLDPELVVIAGSLSDRHGPTLAQAVQDRLGFLPHERPDIRCGALGARAQIRGAVCLSRRSARARLVDAGSNADVVLPVSAR